MINLEKSDFFLRASGYDLLAQFYKYTNPELHIKYYKKHLKYLQLAMGNPKNILKPNSVIHTRFINLLQTEVNIRLNDFEIIKNIPPAGVSEYFIVPTNVYQLDIMPVGVKETALKRQKLEIYGEPYSTYVITDTSIHYFNSEQYLPENETKLRVIHLSENIPSVNVRVKHGDIVFPNVSYGKASNYIGLSPMSINLELTDIMSKKIILSLPNITLHSNNIYSLLIIDDSTKQTGIKPYLIKD